MELMLSVSHGSLLKFVQKRRAKGVTHDRLDTTDDPRYV
jgi:hypothetical protein